MVNKLVIEPLFHNTRIRKAGMPRSRLELAKVPLCFLIGCSSVFGYILANSTITGCTFLIGLAIFVIAMGAATLNSMQEVRLDGELERTSNRPLPKGLISQNQAGLQALVLLVFGLIILVAVSRTLLPVLIVVLSVFLYNAVYTPLKKRTVLAIIPGAICGALPPYIGWLGGGGAAISYPGALLIALFILWQIPHFWLILLEFKEDYVKSSLPNVLKQFSEESLRRFFITWIGALVSVMLMFLVLPFQLGSFFCAILIANACLLFVVFIYGLVIRQTSAYRTLFIYLNFALFMHMLVLAAGRVYAY